MDITLEKQKIKQEIDNINDESLLMSIKKFLGLIKKNQLKPLTKEELIARVRSRKRHRRRQIYFS